MVRVSSATEIFHMSTGCSLLIIRSSDVSKQCDAHQATKPRLCSEGLWRHHPGTYERNVVGSSTDDVVLTLASCKTFEGLGLIWFLIRNNVSSETSRNEASLRAIIDKRGPVVKKQRVYVYK